MDPAPLPDVDAVFARVNAAYLTSRTLARVKHICWQKCIARPDTLDMGFGELSCVDRCVHKWHAAEVMITGIAMEVRKLNEATEQQSLEIQQKIASKLGG
eukprot:GDKJ01025802.1.p1 GENE.GDKJ01025802.1~~GDKJ01025802.1.p1  ORF type:complete len:100 (-),score=14.04 GDKJ01025802.1:46-345(-)